MGTIGPYQLREVVGEGGMGIVYRAEQEGSLKRTVAVKVLKPGLASSDVLARFESERQALAGMNHPNIANIFDAGTTAEALPYFAMEFVAGLPITSYCDEHRLNVRERLELFLQVCSAIDHAHENELVHRDLKPTNILITERQGNPQAKIIDFGIAKALRHRLTERTLFTSYGVLVGTPEYMSPEQASLDSARVDQTSDVYSLGVVLYQLLVGKLPIESSDLREAGYLALERAIRERDPESPSASIRRLATLGAEIAANRQTKPRPLERLLRGDLDCVALKALEKDPARRYQSAGELAADISRHLSGVPIVARAPSPAYRLTKFLRRHRVAALVAIVLLASLVRLGLGLLKPDLKKLQGTWRIVNAEHSGRSEGTGGAVGDFHVIRGDRMIRPRRRTPEYRLELFPGANPKQVNLSAERLGDRTLKGIYRLDGDVFELCYAYDPELPRPSEFESEAGDNRYLYRFRRVSVSESPKNESAGAEERSATLQLGVVDGEGLLRKSSVFESTIPGRISHIRSGDLDPSPGQELGIGGDAGVILLDANDRLVQSVTFAGGAEMVQILDCDITDGCAFMNRGSLSGRVVSLIDHEGRAMWTYNPKSPATDMATGDFDGDGNRDFVVATFEGLDFLDNQGVLIRSSSGSAIFHLEAVDVDDDGTTEIFAVGGDGFVTMNGSGEVVGSVAQPQALLSFSLFTESPDDTERLLLTYAPEEKQFQLTHLDLTPARSLPAPELEPGRLYRAEGVSVRFVAAGPAMAAVLAAPLIEAGPSVLSIYDATGLLRFREVLASANTLAVREGYSEESQALLVGGEAEVFEYQWAASGEGGSEMQLGSEPERRRPPPTTQPRRGWQRLAPFTGVRWVSGLPEIEHESVWFELLAIDRVRVNEIVARCREDYGESFRKRFSEDLADVMATMGVRLGPTVELEVRRLDSGETITLSNVAMSSEKRRQVWLGNMKAAGQLSLGSPPDSELTEAQVREDLEAFRAGLEERFAYLKANDAAYVDAIRRIDAQAAQGMMPSDLAHELSRVLALFIDGHASVSGQQFPEGYLPFLVEPSGSRFVAIRHDRSSLLDKEHPYVVSLDDRPLGEWLWVAAGSFPKGSTQYVRRHALRHLRFLQFYRSELGLEAQPVVRIGLESPDGRSTKHLVMDVATAFPKYGTWPRPQPSRVLDGNVGYLRIPAMNLEAVDLIREWMPRFRNTDGLIVDVRNNGGGSRDALLEFFPFLLAPNDSPRVVNVAAYRLSRSFGKDHLAARYAYRQDWAGWSDEERTAVAKFAKLFEPEWQLPKGDFSQWHYVVISKNEGDGQYYYPRPVVVLLDGKSFSATDIFLGALKEWRNVTLAGTPSGGGSARAQAFSLPNSRLAVRVASMASFQRNGLLYDTNGVYPDVIIEPSPRYFVDGGEDDFLIKALEILKRRPSLRVQALQ